MVDPKGLTTRLVVGPLPLLTLEDRCPDPPRPSVGRFVFAPPLKFKGHEPHFSLWIISGSPALENEVGGGLVHILLNAVCAMVEKMACPTECYKVAVYER